MYLDVFGRLQCFAKQKVHFIKVPTVKHCMVLFDWKTGLIQTVRNFTEIILVGETVSQMHFDPDRC